MDDLAGTAFVQWLDDATLQGDGVAIEEILPGDLYLAVVVDRMILRGWEIGEVLAVIDDFGRDRILAMRRTWTIGEIADEMERAASEMCA